MGIEKSMEKSQLDIGVICPVTGLSIYQKPEWINVRCDKELVVTFSIVEGNILLVQPDGYATINEMTSFISFVENLISEIFIDNRPFIAIEDYKKFKGTSIEARKFFVNHYKTNYRDNFVGIIFCNASNLLGFSIQLAKRLNAFPFQMSLSEDYLEAVRLGQKMLSDATLFSKNLTPLKVFKPPLSAKNKKSNIFRKMFNFIRRANRNARKSFKGKVVFFPDDSTQKHVDQLLRFIGAINWEKDGIDKCEEINQSHPFWPIFKAITLIKSDLDQLFQERKSAEAELRKSEKKYIDIVSNVSDLLYSHDLSGAFTETNIHKKPEWGYQKEDLDNLNVSQLIPNEYQHEFENYLKRIQTQGHDEGYIRLLKKDGSERIAEYRNILICNPKGEPVEVQGYARDITDRIMTGMALKESGEKYLNILESIEDGYYELDIHGNIVFFNDSIMRILGYTKDELPGSNYKQYIDERDVDNLYNMYHSVYKTGNPIQEVQYEIIRKDGQRRMVDASISLIKDPKGQAMGFRGIWRDVSDRIRAEQEKLQLESKLQQARKMEAIGTLAGGIAHDLNNILSGIVSYPELLLLDLPEESPIRKPLLTIQKTGEKAAAIVQDLLTLAQRGVAVTEIVDLNQIISEYLKSPEYEKLRTYHPHVVLETCFEETLLNIIGSPLHLSKAIMNLVSNANEAISEQGHVIISTENQYLDIFSGGRHELPPGEYVVLRISDNGVGIPPNDQERIFEPFYTKKELGRTGTGLGMAVVWGTVKDHNGFVHVDSSVNKGTTFTLYFPATRKAVEKDHHPLSMQRYMGKGESILVVDDSEEQREIASTILKRLGYVVTAVSSGEAAVSYLTQHPVDLVILDMIMDPGIDGLETYAQISKKYPGQKAIIASGYSETGRVKKTLAMGAGIYIRKPYMIEKIGMAVREELDKE